MKPAHIVTALSLFAVCSPATPAWAGGGHHGYHHHTPDDPTDPLPEEETEDLSKMGQLKKFICKDSIEFSNLLRLDLRYLDFKSRGTSAWHENLRILSNNISNHLGGYKFPVIHTYGSTDPASSIQLTEFADTRAVEIMFYVNLGDGGKQLFTAVLVQDADSTWLFDVATSFYLGHRADKKLFCAVDAAAPVAVRPPSPPKKDVGPIRLENLKPVVVTPEMMNQTRQPERVLPGRIDDQTTPLKPVPIRALQRPNDH